MVRQIHFTKPLDRKVVGSLDETIRRHGGRGYDSLFVQSIFCPVDVKLYEIAQEGQVTTQVAINGNAKFLISDGVLVYTAFIQFAGFKEQSEGLSQLYVDIERVLRENEL